MGKSMYDKKVFKETFLNSTSSDRTINSSRNLYDEIMRISGCDSYEAHRAEVWGRQAQIGDKYVFYYNCQLERIK